LALKKGKVPKMFGLFKKEISWQDLEFIFIVSAAEVYQELPLTMPAKNINAVIQKTLNAGDIKLTSAQENAVEMGSMAMQRGSLKEYLQKAVSSDGSLDEAGVIKLIEVMPSHGIFFRDTPTMADLQKSIFGS
jgi:hypothetical protein